MSNEEVGKQPQFEELQLHIDGPIARVLLTRRHRNNLLTPLLLEELVGAAEWLDGEKQVKAVVIDGEGDDFCAGSEIRAFRSQPPRRDIGRLMAEAIAEMGPVSIARLHGRVAGGGAVLAMACDLRFAVAGTRFSFPEARFGWPLNWGTIPRLVREVGPMMAKDLVINSRPLSAQGLVASGLAVFAGEPGQVDEVIQDTLANLSATPAAVIRIVKAYIDTCADSMVSSSAGRSDNILRAAAGTDSEAADAATAAFAELKKKGSIGSCLLRPDAP